MNLVRIPLATATASAFASASVSHFHVCTISSEPVIGFLPNFQGYKTGI